MTINLLQTLELAVQHLAAGELSQTEEICHQILAIDSNCSDAWHLLGSVNAHRNNNDLAEEQIRRAIQINSTVFAYHNSLGNVLTSLERLTEAVTCYRQVVTLSPQFAMGHDNLGMALSNLERYEEAIESFQQALTIDPHNSTILYHLGVALILHKEVSAIAVFKQALTIAPDDADLHFSLADGLLYFKGEVEESLIHFKKSLQLNPFHLRAYDSLVMTLNYSLRDEASIFEEHRNFDEQHALPLATFIRPHLTPLGTLSTRLKIGYVSGDFKKHSMAFFLGFLAHHHHPQFEIFCYHNNAKVDEITQGLKPWADHWCQCETLSDEVLAEQIRADQIDILIDLSGHTVNNRLLVFAQKPAPIQLTYLGFPTTTGMLAIDYRLTDNYVDVAGINDKLTSEEPLAMPNSLFCYGAHPLSPPVNELPSLDTGLITFGCFNSPAKLNPPLLALWTTLLKTIKSSKLLIKLNVPSNSSSQQEFIQRFIEAGIQPHQLILEGGEPVPDYLRTYHRVDIALDTYPFNGGTTTCEALWMGVPVVTLVGQRQVSRLGLSILSTVGLTDLIAHTPEEYLDIGVKLANQPAYLQTLRATMRDRLQNSPLMDAPTFARQLEENYRHIWEQWCTK